MTTEELILGHFDGTLSPEHEARLQVEIKSSAETRSLFEQHKSLQGMLNADVLTLAPSSRLNKAVVAAALGAVPEAIGGGTASWLTAKVAAGISAAVAGGVWIAFVVGSGSYADKPVPQNSTPVPAVSSTPAAPAPIAPAVIEQPRAEQGRVDEESAAGKSVTPAPASRTEKPASGRDENVKRRNPLRLGGEDPTVIEGDTQIRPEGRKSRK